MALVKVCDICGSSKNVNTRQYAFDDQVDIAGGRCEDVYETYDLCLACEVNMFTSSLREIMKSQTRREQYQIGQKFIDYIKNKQQK